MDPADLALRNTTYRLFVQLGRAPTVDEIAREVAAPVEEVRVGWHRLHEAHALVLGPRTDELRMANPFSAIPTAYRVKADGRSWYGNCAWDAFGIGAAMHVDSVIETECPDCGEAIRVAVSDARPDRDELVFHVLVPAANWWADIGYT